MARVFSWKVSESKYSYLIKDSATNSYIRNKITDINALHSMANNVDGWSESTYRDAFMAMRAEVNNVFGNFADSDWRKYFDASPIKGADIVLLSGKDGSNGNGSIKELLSEDDYNELTDAIEKTFEQYRQEIEANADLVRQAIEAQVSSTVRDALNSIAETQAELDGMRSDMEETARSLRDALDAAENADWGEGIPQEELDAINRKIGYFSDWVNHYSGAVLTMKSDYDAASQSIGAWATQQDVSRGLFSMLCTNINVLSGTVGVVQRTINAASGTSQDTASWYDDINGRVTEIESTMNASESYLQQLVKFIDGDDTTQLYNVICGLTASIVSSSQHQGTDESGNTVDLTDVYQRISALSGRVDVEINRLDTTNDTLTTIRTDLNALEGQVSTALTIANDALTKANDMRDTWNAESGMLRTVTDLVIKKDGNGDPIYWYIDPELDDPSDKTQWKRVYYQGEDSETGLPYYTENKDGTGNVYTKDVLPDYMSTMLSYIQQQAGSIELAVTSGDVISALKLTVTEDGDSIIYGFADKVILDSDVIAKSFIANAANIGGVHIGAGMISAGTGNSKWALTSAGTLEANNAILKGSVSADSGYFKGRIEANEGFFKGSVSANSGYFKGRIEANEGEFNGVVRGGEIIGSRIKGAEIILGAAEFYFSANSNNQVILKSDNIPDYADEIHIVFYGQFDHPLHGPYGYLYGDIAPNSYSGYVFDNNDQIVMVNGSGFTSDDIGDFKDFAITLASASTNSITNFDAMLSDKTFYADESLGNDSGGIFWFNDSYYELSKWLWKRNGHFYANGSGTLDAYGGTFMGNIRIPYITMYQLSGDTNARYLDHRTYVYCYGGYFDADTLILPKAEEKINGLTYELLVQPRLSRMDMDGVHVKVADDSTIVSYVSPTLFSDSEIWLKGGKYVITNIINQWAITTASGEIRFVNYNQSTAPLNIVNSNTGLTNIIVYTGSTAPSKPGFDDTLMIKTGGNITIAT